MRWRTPVSNGGKWATRSYSSSSLARVYNGDVSPKRSSWDGSRRASMDRSRRSSVFVLDGRNSLSIDMPRRASIASVCSIQSMESTLPSDPSAAIARHEVVLAHPLELEHSEQRPCGCVVSCLRDLVQSSTFSIGMFMLSFYVLFGDDLRLAFFGKDADAVFNGITIFSIALFTFELVITSIALEDYFLSFFQFLDTISLILDLTFVWESLVGYDTISAQQQTAGEDAAEQSDYARAGRSSRLGTRIARILRVFRLIRMARMVKIVSVQKKRRRERRLSRRSSDKLRKRKLGLPAGLSEDTGPGEVAEAADDLLNSGESRVGKKLSDRTTLWVIILVLAMLVFNPLLDPGETEAAMLLTSAHYGVDTIQQAWQDYVADKTLQRRIDWEQQVLMYTYYHNYYASCPDVEGKKGICASATLEKLCFLGYVASPGAAGRLSIPYIQELSPDRVDWDELFQGSDGDWTQNGYIVGVIPEDIKRRLARPWNTECTVSQAIVQGVSLMRDQPCPWRTFRMQEMQSYFPVARNLGQDQPSGQLVLLFDISKLSTMEAVMSMVRTVFIIIILTMGALLFNADADNLVLHPIERMINKVELIRKNPLYAIKLGDEQHLEQYAEENYARGVWNGGPLGAICNTMRALFCLSSGSLPKRHRRSSLGRDKKVSLETKILENTIIKLGSLLALGFGEAGAEIIGHNLDDRNDGVDAMIPGRKVEAIYGFCQIKDFNVTTEVLQEKTMVFVNQVAKIVHRIVDEHLGAANKNVGEAFLVVWRVGLYEEELRPKIADLSVASFIQVMSAVSRDQHLAELGSHPALLAKSGSYRVRLGFGLHLGWAIEGAIGSEFKIDASYLSSHVNMAMHLETVAKYFNVTILMSEAIVRACSRNFSYYFRPVDNVKLRGSKAPTRLFTVDLDMQALSVEQSAQRPRNECRRSASQRYQDRQQREERKLQKLDSDYLVHEHFSTDRYIRKMRAAYELDFFQEFEKGYVNYESGEWDVATSLFERTVGMLEGIVDGPSSVLLEYMRGFDYQAPPRWPGFRELIEGPSTSELEVEPSTRPLGLGAL
eukprot:CAMPEP_0179173142 /NCGR_PEP_ID=MMETSP0796-20121207/85425_1 /TAXON_ID=73915 /ORGANISM="Pyrodinium bahamense, Strain pbaha01" /LENGTH=1058 /DNA_ID=CAMNT_0020876339 /DNA_START=138 /DNA_END=3312 /DNA_ORIENTATION=+